MAHIDDTICDWTDDNHRRLVAQAVTHYRLAKQPVTVLACQEHNLLRLYIGHANSMLDDQGRAWKFLTYVPSKGNP